MERPPGFKARGCSEKYATAIRLHTASTGALVRRFTSETTHPAHAAIVTFVD
jgi:hypothetical protein